MEVFFSYLKNHIQLTEAEEEILASYLTKRKYLKGQYLLQAGDVCRHQTFILSGKVRTFCLDDNGNEHIITFGIENWWVGDLKSFSSQTAADFNIHCLEQTEVLQISYPNLQQLYKLIPKMDKFFRIILQNAYASLQRRIVRNYSLSAKERYLLFREEYPQIAQRVPLYMVASYLGITKEFLSHIRSDLSKK